MTTTTPHIDRVEHILVVGAGAMGRQIAMSAALAGYRASVQDVSAPTLAHARDDMSAWARKQVDRGRLDPEVVAGALDRLSWTTDLAAIATSADFVIEAASERLEIKTEIFRALGLCTPQHAVLATNSSTYGSSKVAETTGRPENVCNMHFFNPALVMACVEVVRHEETSAETVATTMELARRLSKQPVLINREVPGFVANRLMRATQREALVLAETGVASVEDIDTAVRTALGHPMGPFQLMDLVGLDVIDLMSQATYAETGRDEDAPDGTVRRLVTQGHLGRKSGRGFYDYS